jgi:hypothetical protein
MGTSRRGEAADRERRARGDRDRFIAPVTQDLATPLSVLSSPPPQIHFRRCSV